MEAADASVFWDGIYAIRDLWRHDKPGFTWGLGLALLLIWGTISLAGPPGLRPAAPAIGVLGTVMFSVGMVMWIALIPRRHEEFRHPDR